MNMKRLIFVLMLVSGGMLFAQQDALYSQYMFNQLVLNPAYTGAREAFTVTLVHRHQWASMEGAPRTYSLSVHSPLRDDRAAVGGYVYSDRIGPMQDVGGYGSFAYRIALNKSKLAFGVQAGVRHYDILWHLVNFNQSGDVILNGQVKNSVIPDANFGVYWYSDKFYVGVTSKHLLQNKYAEVVLDEKTVYSTLLRHFYLMGGLAIPIADKIVLKPSTLVKYVQHAPLQVDLNLSALFNDFLWIGASYRTKQALVAILEVNITDQIRVGYSYDIVFNELRTYNKGSHEIMLGFDITRNRRMLSPRFF
ncbi:MAG: hypothetical protein CSA04_05870 [Bacteroidetes bacterium]|nr:MAG: hypothetical protein CSA04_05870 [Bacteroidota bacterium]